MSQFSSKKPAKRLSIVDGCLVTPLDERFATVTLSGELIEALSSPGGKPAQAVLDAGACYVTPGLVDLQVNGGPECNLWDDPDLNSIADLTSTMAACGVTSFLPTLITDDMEHLKKNIAFLEKAGVLSEQARLRHPGRQQEGNSGSHKTGLHARMPGVHLEGPFLSRQRPGVHAPEWISPLSRQAAAGLISSGVKLVTLAPEGDIDGQSIKYLLDQGVKLSLGHSNATFEQAKAAFDQGVSLVTHIFNAMPPLLHRAPGAAAAALLDPRVYCCVIADGLHVAPAIVELIIKIKGVGRTILVTDRAHTGTSGGGLAGSSITLDQAVRNVISWGIASFPEAITMASWNPACALGLEKYIGHLAPGAFADLVLWDRQTLQIKAVVIGGEARSSQK